MLGKKLPSDYQSMTLTIDRCDIDTATIKKECIDFAVAYREGYLDGLWDNVKVVLLCSGIGCAVGLVLGYWLWGIS